MASVRLRGLPTCRFLLQLRLGGLKDWILTHCWSGDHNQAFSSDERLQSRFLVHLRTNTHLDLGFHLENEACRGGFAEEQAHLPSRTHQPQYGSFRDMQDWQSVFSWQVWTGTLVICRHVEVVF